MVSLSPRCDQCKRQITTEHNRQDEERVSECTVGLQREPQCMQSAHGENNSPDPHYLKLS